ncbi:hypothetical protein [Gluconobacter cerinus]|uniref:hypothetical protein n=1 Tax=Gluconobacter cerinus TaxID=38307 RepID=UPI001B8D4E1E|nr:hypothetical protein [Gluconobacter cerinus]MBS1067236.1 hypothetical protein [Gluconobacter cerinus]
MTANYKTASGWSGLPPEPEKSGWHVLALRQLSHSARSGVLVFLSHWCARTRCWGTDRDRRPPQWAVSQGMTYLSHAPDVALNMTLEYRDDNSHGRQ